MEINPNNVSSQEDNPELCAICYEPMNENVYEIPECKHKYHTNCIIDWFRLGKSRCPYCNTNFSILDKLGISNNNDVYYPEHGITSTLLKAQYKDVYNYSKKKTANKTIKTKVNKITQLNKDYKNICKEITDLKKSDTSYKDVKKLLRKLRTKKWSLHRKIWAHKKKILTEVNIVPVIIRKNITIEENQ